MNLIDLKNGHIYRFRYDINDTEYYDFIMELVSIVDTPCNQLFEKTYSCMSYYMIVNNSTSGFAYNYSEDNTVTKDDNYTIDNNAPMANITEITDPSTIKFYKQMRKLNNGT